MNALTVVFAALCIFAIGYRFYGLFIANKVLNLNDARVTPAVKYSDGHDYVDTNKYVLFGHHFAAIAAAGPKLLRIGPSSFVMDLHGGWLASGLPTAMLEKMLQTPHLVESIEVVPLELDQVEGAVREHFDGRFIRAQKPLDVINWELSSVALRDVVLKPGGDLTFQLRRFPNFTLLEQVGPLDVQLAAICSRMTQSLHDLLRAFPRHEQDVLRFAVLCVVSGLAVVVPPAARPTFAPANAAKQPPAATRPAARAIAQGDSAVRRGFFKSLLDKLF